MTQENSSPESDGAAEEAHEEQPAAPLNRAERRAQSKGKKGAPESGLLANLRANNVQGMTGRQSGGSFKSRLPRTGHK